MPHVAPDPEIDPAPPAPPEKPKEERKPDQEQSKYWSDELKKQLGFYEKKYGKQKGITRSREQREEEWEEDVQRPNKPAKK